MRLLLLGANGQLGLELSKSLTTSGDVISATRTGVLPGGESCEVADLDRPEDLPELVRRVAPDVVINAAAYTAVDRAEDERASVVRANTRSPDVLARACAERDILFVHYSTDYVFDGRGRRPYREEDPTAPLGVYGASKLAGEEAIRAVGGRHLILRTAWAYARHSRNFMQTMLRLGSEYDQLKVVADQIGTPTPAYLIADATVEMLDNPAAQTGTFHLTARGETSWHGFAEAIFEEALARGLISRAPRLLPVTTPEYPTRARRPAYSHLDVGKLERTLGHPLPDWRTGLRQVFEGR
ncbi:MAG TPA: dTDP-4-dehydrorhamnose reductase [Pseudoxanthomonas sp.]